jgi:acetyltransferase-like isoleucine patch superfamily enzyme
MIKKKIQRFLKLRTDVDLSYYLTSFFFKHILFHHRQLPWHIHHTSTVYSPQKIVRGKGVYPGDSPGNYIEASNGIFIGDYTNLGPNVGLIVGAGAVVTKSFSEGYCVIGGNPARIIKHLDKNACEQYREKKGG